MKKLKLFATSLFFCLLANNLAAQLQQIKIVSFTVKNQLPAIIDSWTSTPAALILVAQKIPSPVPMREPRLVVQIRSGGAVVCGNTPANARPVDPFDVRTFNTADLTGFLTNCHELKEGIYTICVQFFNIDKVAISQEVCKDFKVEDAAVDYSPPTLITPDNGKKFSLAELQQPVQFRWTPLVPKPREPVTYRLKVWQLMQGQNGIAAMRSNTPVVEKDVKEITQAVVTGIITGPCKPPYMCDFIWNVQAINRDGKPMGRNNGLSEPYTFSATEEKGKGPVNTFPEDAKKFTLEEATKPIMFRWTPLLPKPQGPVTYRLKVWQLMQGQNGQQAMRTNKPIIEKEMVDAAETTVNGIITGPCKPPYMCDFIWQVQALDRTGQVIGETKEWSFGATSPAVTSSLANTFPTDKKQFTPDEAKGNLTFRWTPCLPKPQGPVTYRLKVWQLMQGQNGTQAMRSNQPIIVKDVDNITQAAVTGIYTGPCKPPYMCDFIWEVQAMNKSGILIGESESWSFSIHKNDWPHGPKIMSPGNDTIFTENEAKKPVTFKWTPILPRPQEPVTYRLKVWQLMQGQNGTQAMKSNQPIVTKDVKDISEVILNGVITGPCKPPYMCDFVWNVQAMDRTGLLIGESESWSFGATNPTANSIANTSPADKKQFTLDEAKGNLTFRWTPLVPKPRDPVTYRLKVWQLMQGQNGQQAMRTNKPIIEKEMVDAAETTVNGIITGPCKPPYMCDFIWNVEAVNKKGKPIDNKKRTSENFVFKIKEN